MKPLYDALIEGIPDDLIADDVVSTHYGVVVRCGGNVGISEFRDEYDTRPMIDTVNRPGMKLKKLAEGIKSWNMTEAAMGHAAMNAYYNSAELAEKNGLYLTKSLFSEDRNADPFITLQKEMQGKNVVIIGHFPFIDKLLKPICNLHIINHDDCEGDYPEQAAEYLLPGCDYAFFGGLTIADKRLPGLLELAKNAYVGLVGPVVMLSPILFDYGVDELDGFVSKDPGMTERIFKEQEFKKIYASGQKVSLKKKDYEALREKQICKK